MQQITFSTINPDLITRSNVAAIISNKNGEVLYCQRNTTKKFLPGAWHLPGGKVEKGETYQEALFREIKEELSLTISKIKETNISHIYSIEKDLHETRFYLVKVSGKVILDFENSDYKFLKISQLSEYLEDHVLEINRELFKIAKKSSLISNIS